MATLPKPLDVASVRWRPLAAHDLPVVAALEARIHAAPWSERNFRDALAAGYSARVGVAGERIVAYGVLMLGPGEALGADLRLGNNIGADQPFQGDLDEVQVLRRVTRPEAFGGAR